MGTRFDFKGGFADQAAHRRQRHQKTPEKIDAIIDWRPIEALLDKVYSDGIRLTVASGWGLVRLPSWRPGLRFDPFFASVHP